MGKLGVFNFMTLNGLFEGAEHDISWHPHDAEGAEYASDGLSSEGTLLFGRKTYDLMVQYWPTPMAEKNDPAVAAGMNTAEKIVFSRTLTSSHWTNTRFVNDNIGEEVRKLKQIPGKNLTILGSGSIVTQLAELNLIDEYQFVVDPVVLSSGTPIFNGINRRLDLKLVSIKAFKNGGVVLTYRPG
jgi:dihydrofolate reductase